jgi:hypothetical protein
MNLDDLIYQINYFPPTITDYDDDCLKLIARVLMRLPEDVREQTLESVQFIFMTGPYGQFVKTFCPPHEDELIRGAIVLNFSAMEKETEEYKMTVVAHEIAHFILDHHHGGDEIEEQTDDLCEKWGFGRAY